MTLRVACVVEGHGDVASIPEIVRRIALEAGHQDVQLVGPFRINKSKLLREGELERAVERAARSLGGRGAILVVVDADDDLPCELGPRLTRRAASARPDIRTCVVVANREKEAWYLAAVHSLRGFRGVPRGSVPPPNPEAIRDAKGWLARQMRRRYSEVTDQAAFAHKFSLEQARQGARSFERIHRWMIAELERQASAG